MLFPPRFSTLLATLLHATQLIQVSMATYIDLLPRSGPLHKRSTSGLLYQGASYNINITLGGVPFVVLIDTGRWATDSFSTSDGVRHSIRAISSADLWVAGTVTNANTTGVSGTIQYVDTSDTGVCILNSLARNLSSTFCAPFSSRPN